MVTISDVAREAKVSVATVSRVLNNSATVLPETTSRVRKVIERLHYEPNVLARNFRTRVSHVVLILAPNITNPYYANILTGISLSARRHGYSILICTVGGEREREMEYLDILGKHHADGAILLAMALNNEDLERYSEKYPLVQCSEFVPGTKVAHVSIDNYKAAYQLTEHLLCIGHRRIAMVSSVNDYPSTRQRMDGYRDALLAAGVPFQEDYIRYGSFDYSFSSGYSGAQSLLSLKTAPTAIFCISDMLALGAINGAQDMGLNVPGDVSVVGFDDVEHATMIRPHITTIAQPCFQLGECAMELLYERLRGDKNPRKEIILGTELKLRSSSAPV